MVLSRVRATGGWLAGARCAVVLCVAPALAVGASGASAEAGPPVLTFSPSTYDFVSVPLGKTGAQTFTLKNTGGSPAAPAITLPGSSAFAIPAVSDMCTATVLEPGGSCTVAVQFAPTAMAAVTASLNATSKKPAATATASLSGTGTLPSLAGETFRKRTGGFSPGSYFCGDDSQVFTFSVAGIATGPFPGTFTESGSVSLDPSDPSNQRFNSKFTITSGSLTLTGTNSAGPSGFSGVLCEAPSVAHATVDAATLSNAGGDAGAATITILIDSVDNLVTFTQSFRATLGAVHSSSHCAHNGNNVVCGAGNDTVLGGRGNDRLFGGAGNDTVLGGRGNDRLFGAPGNDVIFGGPGNDRIDPGSGRDHVSAGPGNDRVLARDRQRDVIDCGPGHDVAIVDRVDVTRRCEVVTRTRRRR
jgi:Ca2+-binding RTX toxin-like protein